jgi:transcription initiation factor IIE alpha subunit
MASERGAEHDVAAKTRRIEEHETTATSLASSASKGVCMKKSELLRAKVHATTKQRSPTFFMCDKNCTARVKY